MEALRICLYMPHGTCVAGAMHTCASFLFGSFELRSFDSLRAKTVGSWPHRATCPTDVVF